MKLRIRGNSIRLRLTKSEVRQISLGLTVEESVHFGPESQMRYCLVPSHDMTEIKARFTESCLSVFLPLASAREWAESSVVSLNGQQGIETNQPLVILIEKDFFCLKPRSSHPEDESDMYPHPHQSTGQCG